MKGEIKMDKNKTINLLKRQPDGFIIKVVWKNSINTLNLFYIISKKGQSVRHFYLDDNNSELIMEKESINIENIFDNISGYEVYDVETIESEKYSELKDLLIMLYMYTEEDDRKSIFKKVKEILN